MDTIELLVVALVAVAAAVRSTWSPCGRSMLASITPLAEAGRRHRYGTTAAWFVVGATLGGACLGAVTAALAAGVGAAHLAPSVVAGAALVACLVALASDTHLGGFALPVHHRQVNERWLDQFRPWVYGAGFGFQIGCGLATYIMTAAVYLVVVLGALGGRPVAAVALGAGFGLVRGLAVLLGRSITAPAALTAFHRRFEAWGPASRRLVLGTEVLAAVVFAGGLSTWAALVGAAAAGLGLAATLVARRPTAVGPDGQRAPGDEPGPRLTPGPG